VNRPLWIDTDMGSDDAVALIMALRSDTVQVVGISTVAGNVPVRQATKNALQVVELCGARVPVHAGATGPLERSLESAEWFHGPDGLSGMGRESVRREATTDGVDGLTHAAAEHHGLVLVTLGPLTNIARALSVDRSFAARVSRCVVMGGAACTYGNVTPAAEYNIWVDPEAARQVFLSGMPVEMVGWEFCQGEYALDEGEISRIESIGTEIARFVISSSRCAMDAYRGQTGETRLSLPDPVAMAIALDPEIVTARGRHLVEVETQSELTRGMTVVDWFGVAGDGRNLDSWREARESGQSVTVTWGIDTARWKELLYQLLE